MGFNKKNLVFWIGQSLVLACTHSQVALNPELGESKRKPANAPISTESPTKFAGLEKLFQRAHAPSRTRFQREEYLLGKCVFASHPQTFIADSANIFVEADRMLGKMIYFIPSIFRPTGEATADSTLARQNLVLARNRALRARENFSNVQFQYPNGNLLTGMARAKLTDSAYLSYAELPPDSEKKGLPMLGQFRIRALTLEAGRDFILLEHLCPYLTGCRLQNAPQEFHFLEPYGYCYYARAIEYAVATPELESRIPVLLPRPIREPAGEFEAFVPND